MKIHTFSIVLLVTKVTDETTHDIRHCSSEKMLIKILLISIDMIVRLFTLIHFR